MMDRVPYDDFVDIYDSWVASAPITRLNQAFYVKKLLEPQGPVVELGVGNGRICVEVARQGKSVIGVDSSSKILDLCRRRAKEAGVSDRLTLIQADFRDFELDEPAELITIPFHTIGHLLTLDDKLAAMKRIYSQLRPGGRFIFDHFLFDPNFMQQAVPHLRAELRDPESGRDRILWEVVTRDDENQRIRILVWTDEIDAGGTVVNRRYRRNNISWLTPDQSRTLLEEAGFTIENVYGDFDENPLQEGSTHQIWIARR